MTDGGVAFQPDQEQATVPFRPRSAYVGHRAFGRGDGAVLVEPEVAHDLRAAAEYATQEGRVAGGLLYGHAWGDDLGVYLVVDGFLEAGPGEDHGDRLRDGDRDDDYELSAADLRLLREDAARMYSAAIEVGWWRTRGSAGVFGTRDFATQAELAGPGGAGLLVYGSGPRWGTAYLGPDGQAPDAIGRLVAAADPAVALAPRRPVPEAAAPEGLYEPDGPYDAAGSEPEVIDLAAGESLAEEPPEPGRLEPAEVIDLGAGESLLEETLPEPAGPAEVIDLAAGESLLSDPVDDEELPDDPLPGDPMPGEPLPHHSLPEEPLDDDFFEPLAEPPLADGPLDTGPSDAGFGDGEFADEQFPDGEFADEVPVADEAPPAAATTGTALATRQTALIPAPKPAGPRVISPVRVPRGEWGTHKEANPSYVGPHTPLDVQIVVGGLIIVPVIAAVIIGILVNSAIVAVVAAVVFLLAVLGVIWMSRL
jgi:hypothetical protein